MRLLVVATIMGLAGCAGVKYSDSVTARDLIEARNSQVTTQVLATAMEWRNSGAIVRPGVTYRISADGRWRAAGTCDWTGPDGEGMYGLLCPPWEIGRVISGRPHQLLIGRIGDRGAPFAIGAHYEFAAPVGGVLYLSMNEDFGGAWDNAGSLRVTIALAERPEPAAKEGPPRGARPATPARFPETPIAMTFPKRTPRPDDIAAIIGYADYGKQAKDIPDVTPAYADAEGFRRYAVEALGLRDGNIIQLRDATGAQMVRVFGSKENHRGQLFDWVRPGRSRVYVYYAGHGAPGGEDGSAYLVPADADAARIHLNGYPLSLLYENLGKLPAVAVTVVLEACFSGVSQAGTVVARASTIVVTPKAPRIPAGLTVISAGALNQIASWEDDSSHGLFTKYFLKAMGGEADQPPYGNRDGTVDWLEVAAYLKESVTYYARRYYGRDQAPQILVGD